MKRKNIWDVIIISDITAEWKDMRSSYIPSNRDDMRSITDMNKLYDIPPRSIENEERTNKNKALPNNERWVDIDMIKFLNEIEEPKVSELGGKGYSLAALINNGFNVPKGFVITSEAFFKFLKENKLMERIEKLTSEINESNFQEKSSEIRELILKGKILEEIVLEIKEALNKLNVEYVSIRSSAVSEDSLKASFAGLHDTFLNVKTELDTVLEDVKKCWASLFNERATLYRIRKKTPHLEGMAVIVQELIPADVAGTAFTAHPDTGDKNVIIIEATWGLGETLVSGSVTPDLYVIDKRTFKIIKKSLGRKEIFTIPSSEGYILTPVFKFMEKKLKSLQSQKKLINF